MFSKAYLKVSEFNFLIAFCLVQGTSTRFGLINLCCKPRRVGQLRVDTALNDKQWGFKEKISLKHRTPSKKYLKIEYGSGHAA